MKKSRIAAVALATALTAGAVTPVADAQTCLLYTSDAADDLLTV